MGLKHFAEMFCNFKFVTDDLLPVMYPSTHITATRLVKPHLHSATVSLSLSMSMCVLIFDLTPKLNPTLDPLPPLISRLVDLTMPTN